MITVLVFVILFVALAVIVAIVCGLVAAAPVLLAIIGLILLDVLVLKCLTKKKK